MTLATSRTGRVHPAGHESMASCSPHGAAQAAERKKGVQRTAAGGNIATLDKCRKDKRPNTPAINRSGT